MTREVTVQEATHDRRTAARTIGLHGISGIYPLACSQYPRIPKAFQGLRIHACFDFGITSGVPSPIII